MHKKRAVKPEALLSEQDLEGTLASRTGPQPHWMDEIISQAQKDGEFDFLKGKGKSLHLPDYDPYAGSDADGYRILKNAGFAPEWAELRPKIVEQITWLREHPSHPERVSRIVLVNEMIDKHNRMIPNPALAFPRVPRDFGKTQG